MYQAYLSRYDFAPGEIERSIDVKFYTEAGVALTDTNFVITAEISDEYGSVLLSEIPVTEASTSTFKFTTEKPCPSVEGLYDIRFKLDSVATAEISWTSKVRIYIG